MSKPPSLYAQNVLRLAYSQQDLDGQDINILTEGYSSDSKKELLSLCETRKYTPAVARLFIKAQLETKFWRQKLGYYKKRNQQILSLMDQLFLGFQRAGVEKVALYDNFAAFLLNSDDLELAASGDFDLCADESERNGIRNVLATMDFARYPNPHSTKEFRDFFNGQIGHEPFRINVNFVPLLRYMAPFEVDYNKVFDWGDLVHFDDSHIRLLKPDSVLYLNLLRISLHSYVRTPDYRLYLDVFNGLRTKPNWDVIFQWAKHDGMTLRIAAVLQLCSSVFGMSVPVVGGDLNEQEKRFLEKLSSLLWHEHSKLLKLNPSRARLVQIEAYSNGRTLASELRAMLMPPMDWVVRYHGVSGGVASAYATYYRRFLGWRRKNNA